MQSFKHCLIEHLYLKGFKPKECRPVVHKTSPATVCNRVGSLMLAVQKDELRSGRPVEVTASEVIDNIHNIWFHVIDEVEAKSGE